MRISDWSSDVCSSDLRRRWTYRLSVAATFDVRRFCRLERPPRTGRSPAQRDCGRLAGLSGFPRLRAGRFSGGPDSVAASRTPAGQGADEGAAIRFVLARTNLSRTKMLAPGRRLIGD